jgi:hypothetical protein
MLPDRLVEGREPELDERARDVPPKLPPPLPQLPRELEERPLDRAISPRTPPRPLSTSPRI